jgi:hypothetical protein
VQLIRSVNAAGDEDGVLSVTLIALFGSAAQNFDG